MKRTLLTNMRWGLKPSCLADAGKPLLTNKEYDSLKEQLLLSGSKMPTLSKDELVFLQATRAYCMGQPVMADNDYNILKAKLKQRSSVVTAEGPRCSIRSRRMYADCRPDNLRQQLLSAPFVVALLSLMTAADSLVDFDKLMDVPMAGTLMWVVLTLIVIFITRHENRTARLSGVTNVSTS